MVESAGPDKLSLIVFSGTFEKVHYALVLASGAAAVGKPVTLFFTMDATRALLKPGSDDLPGWAGLPASNGHDNGSVVDNRFKAKNIGDFETLLGACREMNVTFMVCEMGLRALDIATNDLRNDINIQPGGVVTFINDASNSGAMMFI